MHRQRNACKRHTVTRAAATQDGRAAGRALRGCAAPRLPASDPRCPLPARLRAPRPLRQCVGGVLGQSPSPLLIPSPQVYNPLGWTLQPSAPSALDYDPSNPSYSLL